MIIIIIMALKKNSCSSECLTMQVNRQRFTWISQVQEHFLKRKENELKELLLKITESVVSVKDAVENIAERTVVSMLWSSN